MSTIPYWQQRQQQKLKGTTGLEERHIPDNRKPCKITQVVDKDKELKNNSKKKPAQKKCKNTRKKSTGKKKRIKARSKKQVKKMRELAKINKEILGDKTRDLTEPCQIQGPTCTYYATVLNHDEGRDGANLLDKTKMTPCCPACNLWIEEHHEEARQRGFKRLRHGTIQRIQK